MKRKTIVSLLSAFVLCCSCEKNETKTAAYVDYPNTQEAEAPVSQKITNRHLTQLNQAVNQYLKENKRTYSGVKELLVQSYVKKAQEEFLNLSRQTTGQEKGSLVPITIGILRLFDPNAKLPQLQRNENDPDSVQLAEQILPKYKKRLQSELALLHNYPLKEGEYYWHPKNGFYGLNFGSIKPWYLAACSEFRCPAPPLHGPEMDRQVELVKRAMKQLDQDKLAAIMYWKDSGDWLQIADDYMQKNNVPLAKRIHVLAILSSTLTDALAAAFDSKYTYWVRRPAMVDTSIHTVIPTPSHPSYPSGHSTVGSAAATILDHYFPENQQEWNKLALQAGLSRIWAGIHFPMDHIDGTQLGNKVAEKALEIEEDGER